MVVTDGNQPRRIDVPVEVPAGVNQAMVDSDQPMISGYVGGSIGSRKARSPGIEAGIGGGVGFGRNAAPPPNMPASVTVTAQASLQMAQAMPFEISREKSKE